MAASPLPFLLPILRWERRKKGNEHFLLPNVVDTGSSASISVAQEFYRLLGVVEDERAKSSSGTTFEAAVAAYLRRELPLLDDRPWDVRHPGSEITQSGQYAHFADVRRLIRKDPALLAAIGTDYLIKPDVTVHLPRRFGSAGDPGTHPAPGAPLLHASVSCKWTIRSDRVQNVRPEARDMVRYRRGRLPHIVLVTAEPTVGRIASIAKGTGDLDMVFHIALGPLEEAMRRQKLRAQADDLRAMIKQGRIMDLASLPEVLAEW